MAYAATRIELPIKLVMPLIIANPLPTYYNACGLIGLGDIVIPGLLTTFAYNFDINLRTKVNYFTNKRFILKLL
jgi:hypothetical protein